MLAPPQLQVATVHEAALAVLIEDEFAYGQRRRRITAAPPRQRTYSRRELLQLKGLEHVVVRTEIEAAHTVFQPVASREYQQGSAVAVASQAHQHLQPAECRQAKIQHDHGIRLPGLVEGGLAIEDPIDRKALRAKECHHAASERLVIFNDEHTHPTEILRVEGMQYHAT